MLPNKNDLITNTDTMSSTSEPRILSSASSSASGSGTSNSSSTSSPPEYKVVPHDSFDTMDLDDDVLRGLYGYGFTKPSKPQRTGIVPLTKRKDVVFSCESGTGKTGTFVVGTLNCIDPTVQAPQVVIINPIRELAHQTADVFRAIGKYLKVSESVTGVKVMTATGGTPVSEDLKALRNGAQVIVGTPGRIFDLLGRGLNLKHLKYLILDEADKLFESGFAEQISEILGTGKFPDTTSLALFSATLPEIVQEMAEKYLKKDRIKILIPKEEVKLEGIKQFYIDCEKPEWKNDVLADLYKYLSFGQGIIFASTKFTVEKLAKWMVDQNFTVEYIHGDMLAPERAKRMQDFRTGAVRILISTDVLARGIDVQAVSTVINYEMPSERDDYWHRIGRTGRYGKKGVSINLIAGADEMSKMKEIESHYSMVIPMLPEDLSVLTSSK